MTGKNIPRALAALLLLMLMVAAIAVIPRGTAAQSSATPSSGAPGELIRWEPIPSIAGHDAWRILYTSTGLDGSTTPVSGIIALPNAPPPAEGYPLLAVGHPTAGLGRQCAPSLLLYESGSPMAQLYEQTLAPYLDAGFAIVMTDYQGLGLAGDPSYLIGAIEGSNILDSIVAARQFPEAELSQTTLLIGHSQGGHAVAFAIQMAPEYDPELSIAGAVLAAPALDPAGIFASLTDDDVASEDTSLVLMVMSAWSTTYPDASLEQVATPTGREVIETRIANACLIEAGLAAAGYSPSELFLPGAATAWADLSAENTPAPGPWTAPVLIVHGASDEVIDLRMTAEFVDGLCASGTTVAFNQYPGTDHFGILSVAQSDIQTWLLERIATKPAPSTCAT